LTYSFKTNSDTKFCAIQEELKEQGHTHQFLTVGRDFTTHIQLPETEVTNNHVTLTKKVVSRGFNKTLFRFFLKN
jgi:hypothetical protein